MKQFFYLILFASFFGNLTSASMAFAKTYTGRLDKSNGRYFLSKNNNRFELQINDMSIEFVLQKLKNKDYVSLEGNLIPSNSLKNRTSKIKVTDINYVGLNELLGFWKDQTGVCYYFSSFTSLKTFYPNSKTPCSNKSSPRSDNYGPSPYNYFVSPDDDDIWSILLSSKEEQFFGELFRVDSKTLKLTLYNSTDGLLVSESLLFQADP